MNIQAPVAMLRRQSTVQDIFVPVERNFKGTEQVPLLGYMSQDGGVQGEQRVQKEDVIISWFSLIFHLYRPLSLCVYIYVYI